MALCFSHGAAGYLGYEAVRPAGVHRPALLAAAVLLANGPDLDFLPGLIVGHPGAFHRGATHTVAAVAAIALLVALGARLLGRPALRPALWAGALWMSHLALDYFTTDARPPYGARFLWPFSDAYYLSPVTPLPEIVIDPSGRTAFFASLIAPSTAHVWLHEMLVLALAVVGVYVLRACRAPIAWRDALEDS
jgi:membrane-bound metal-dependent hydrolase YbcI (DUF457 family)